MPEIASSLSKTSCIINPAAANYKWRRSRKLREHLHREFPGQIFDQSNNKEGIIDLARTLCMDRNIIVAAGGDGTLADVMQGIHNSGRAKDVTLGIVPLGSGNAVRSSLLIPKQTKMALRVLKKGRPRYIDLIDVEGRIANFVSVGATAKVSYEKTLHPIPGMLGHILAARILFTCPREWMDIELFDGLEDSGERFDRKKIRMKILDCVVNKTNHFGYSWLIAPKARIDDGYLDITLFDMRAYNYFLYFPLIYIGLFQKVLKHYKAKKVILRGKNLYVQYNGETLETRDKVELTVLPGALKIISP